MDTKPFQTVAKYLNVTPTAKWVARLTSALASFSLVALFPVLYLFLDLMTNHGLIPAYHELSATQQESFRERWADKLSTNEGIQNVLPALRPEAWAASAPPNTEWEWRWQASVREYLRTAVNEQAANQYLPLPQADTPTSPPQTSTSSPTNAELGMLGLVVRGQQHWTGKPLAWVARWNTWTWTPNTNGTANPGYLFGLFILAITLTLMRAVCLHGSLHQATAAAIDAVGRVRRTMFNHSSRLGALSTRYEAQQEAGQIVTNRTEFILDGLITSLTSAIRGPLTMTLLLLFLFASNFWITFGVLLVAAFIWMAAGQMAQWFRNDGRIASRRVEARLKTMREAFLVTRMVKAYLMERFSQNRFERQLAEVSRASWRRHRGEALSRPLILTLTSIASVIVLFVCGRVVLGGDMSVAGLIVKAAGIAMFLFTLNRWVAAQVRLRRAREASAEVVEFLDRRGDSGQSIDAEFLPPLTKKLEFVDVSFREAGTGKMILENVSFQIAAKSRTAVVFSNPHEAEAIANLITRFADPTAGEIRFDGKNIRWVTFESIRTQTALVLEADTTFTDTVANNIGCGDGSYSLPQIIEAAKIAHAHQLIQRLPYGYETLIGDGGVSLRPGERFRIALARAILRDPSLLILEEPAEPLDADSWVLIDDTITRIRADRTILFLARRPSTIRSAESVLVLQNGRLVATGRHDDLLEKSDVYRLFHQRQNLVSTAS